jgi:O-antigen/teichoic acid export membrane protein
MAGSTLVQLAGMALTFLVGVQLARGLGVERYGQYGIAMAVIVMASIPGEFGLPRLLTREVAAAQARSDLPRLFAVLRWSDRLCYLMSAAAAAVVILGTLAIYGRSLPPVATAILFGAPIIPLAALARLRGATLQGLHHVVLGQIPPVLLRPLFFSAALLILFQLVSAADAAHAMALNAGTAAVALAFAAYWTHRRLPSPQPTETLASDKRWLSSALTLGLGTGIWLLQGQLAVFVLALLASDVEVGLFRIGLSIIALLVLPMTLIANVISPQIASLHSARDRAGLQRLATSSARLQFAGVLLITLPFLLAAEPIVTILFGTEYEGAAAGLRILCAGQIFSALFGINATLLTMTRHEGRLTRAVAVGLIASVALTVILVPRLGNAGAAWAYSASYVVWNLIAWIDARRLLGVNTLLR